MTTNEKLRSIMASKKLTRSDVARLSRVSVHAVDAWLRDPAKQGYRQMPLATLELIAFKLNNDNKEGTNG